MTMLKRISAIATILTFAAVAPAAAQFKQSETGGPKLGDSQTTCWRTGIIVTAVGGACRGITGYAPVPTDWPEQQVKVTEEEISPEAKITYQMVDGGVKIMNLRIPQLAASREAKALITVEITRCTLLPPDDTDGFVILDVGKLPREVRLYLAPSPMIESRHPSIRKLAKEVGADETQAWKRVEAIYDWVREKVKYENGPIKGALAALRDGTGDCEELTSLFIAICRAAGIPARTVWVPGHCYPEFYLSDEEGNGFWFPCQAAGTREFGGITETRPVLQKGDNFRPPTGGRERQRYMAEYLTGTPSPGGGKPQVRFIRENVAQ